VGNQELAVFLRHEESVPRMAALVISGVGRYPGLLAQFVNQREMGLNVQLALSGGKKKKKGPPPGGKHTALSCSSHTFGEIGRTYQISGQGRRPFQLICQDSYEMP